MEVTFSQCRHGKSKLNFALYKIEQTVSPLCEYCMTNETVNHYFTNCNRFMLEIKLIKRSLEGNRVKTFDLQTPLSNPQTMHDTEKFIRSTERLI